MVRRDEGASRSPQTGEEPPGRHAPRLRQRETVGQERTSLPQQRGDWTRQDRRASARRAGLAHHRDRRDRHGSPGRPPFRASARDRRSARRAVSPRGACAARQSPARASVRAVAGNQRTRSRARWSEDHRVAGPAERQTREQAFTSVRGRWRASGSTATRSGHLKACHQRASARAGRVAGWTGSRGWR